MNRENEQADASDREADLFERKFHQDLAWKLSGTGIVWAALAVYFIGSVVLLAVFVGLTILFFAKAWEHRSKAKAVEARIRRMER